MSDPQNIPDGLSLAECLEVAIAASRAAGKKIVDMLYSAEVHEKSSKDLVTDADIAAQAIIFEVILARFPNHQFVGEEGPPPSGLMKPEPMALATGFDFATSCQIAPEASVYGSEKMPLSLPQPLTGIKSADPPPEIVSSIIPPNCWCWVVDPIDGTANYVHRFPNFAVSIALVRDGTSYVGVVYDPMADELFSAVLSEGARLNAQPIHCSGCKQIDRALIAASFPPNVQRGCVEIEQFIEVLVEAQSLRRLGSAALNLCYVACGRLDGYWAGKVRSWDVAAGILIAEEAGCKLTRMNGSPFVLNLGDLTVASSAPLHAELLGCLNRVS
ncbi:MAG: inositol monophosphatase family protein [Planctomycetota bacterium]|nr:inositol monophosphatase family protein [Planctomycetota bacterium]